MKSLGPGLCQFHVWTVCVSYSKSCFRHHQIITAGRRIQIQIHSGSGSSLVPGRRLVVSVIGPLVADAAVPGEGSVSPHRRFALSGYNLIFFSVSSHICCLNSLGGDSIDFFHPQNFPSTLSSQKYFPEYSPVIIIRNLPPINSYIQGNEKNLGKSPIETGSSGKF